MLTTSPETSGECEQGVPEKGIQMENVCRFLSLWDTLGEMNWFFSHLSGRQASKEVSITLWWDSPVEFTLGNYCLQRGPWRWVLGPQHGWIRRESQAEPKVEEGQGKMPLFLQDSCSQHRRTFRRCGKGEILRCLWGTHDHTTNQGFLFALSLINMYLREEYGNRVCPRWWNMLRLFMLNLLFLGNLKSLCKSTSDYNIFHFNHN